MDFAKVPVSARATRVHRLVEQLCNRGVRSKDSLLGALRVGGRRADYDDEAYAFEGGPCDELRRKHFDKSLRLLWKAEQSAPFLDFKDANPLERTISQQALEALSSDERAAVERMSSAEFKALLKREYTLRERQALVNLLSAVGHGEAYAWLVASDMVGALKSTGAKAAATAQVLEEAKHFVVLRELILAFDLPVPRLTAWEYNLLEGVLRMDGLEKLFGMNVIVEGIALSLFGALGHLPGMEVLKLFHLDEARHTALPQNYFKVFPMSRWQRHSPLARLSRFRLILGALPLVFALEEDMAEVGLDVFEFGGSVVRKTAGLAKRVGFFLPVPLDGFVGMLDVVFNTYCTLTRPGHSYTRFSRAETSHRSVRGVEREILGAALVGG
ncbi:MAG: hypothetical protein KDD82_05510 [Planctomycetes bacterium]|nr:hypothetical protein [Planctomycetota bacterium]